MNDELLAAAERALEACRLKGLRIAAAESCTGGLLSGALTEISGSSDVFDRGFVTYSNAAKTEVLGVPAEVLHEFGAVSAPTAKSMALNALARSAADLAVSITGIAGPGGGSPDKPVGLVYVAVARRGGRLLERELRLEGLSRAEVRRQTVLRALGMLVEQAREA
jgi:nicotinamide-nucleotide amidase